MSSVDMHRLALGLRFLRARLRRKVWPRLSHGMLLLPALAGSMAYPSGDGTGDGSAWDNARAALQRESQGPMAQAIERWKALTGNTHYDFSAYANFITSYPGFPDEDKLRRNAEAALDHETPDSSALVAFFDRFPPLTNPGRAAYALALHNLGRPEAADMARAAWRGGPMSDAAEAAIQSTWGAGFITADHDARIDALLWAGAVLPAQRVLALTSPAAHAVALGRLAAINGGDPYAAAALPADQLDHIPGYVFQRARELHRLGRIGAEAAYLGARPAMNGLPLDRPRWIAELLAAARGAVDLGDSASAVKVAQGAADAFAPGEDITQQPYGVRDDYTSLMWLGGTQALWRQNDGPAAAALFRRYADAARGPGVKAKGLYWAGLALQRTGHAAEARDAFAAAASHPAQFYGLLAAERIGQPTPHFADSPLPAPAEVDRVRFVSAPLTAAVRELARDGDWHTTIRFFKEIADQQQTPGQFALVADLAQTLGRRDLGVIVGQAAESRGIDDFRRIAYPLIPVPPEQTRGWTMVHAIIRQESQFAQNAVSHAGARGLMQMMPATGAEQARKLGLAYSADGLIANPRLNMAIGGAYFDHLLTVFGGSYPLAVAAYNAGAGNVGKWLRANGDPRTGQIEWVDWIERIPLTETRGYVTHVLENAVVYEAMNPDKASYGGPNPMSHFLGKSTPG